MRVRQLITTLNNTIPNHMEQVLYLQNTTRVQSLLDLNKIDFMLNTE
jgi:hypothetical protein